MFPRAAGCVLLDAIWDSAYEICLNIFCLRLCQLGMTAFDLLQRIRRRLRHLNSLEARNLRDEGSNASLEGSTCFYKLWQRKTHPTEDQQAMTWLYTSEQVRMMPPCETCACPARCRLHRKLQPLLTLTALALKQSLVDFPGMLHSGVWRDLPSVGRNAPWQ